MTGKIFRSILAASVSTLVAALLVVAGMLYTYYSEIQSQQLGSQLDFAVQGVEKDGIPYLDSLKNNNCRLTLIESDGKVLYDTYTDPKTMENHLDREEIQGALKTGYGKSERYSSTLLEKTVYVAKRLSDGSVLRISETRSSAVMMLVKMATPIVIILIFAAAISVLLANRMAIKIVEPLEKLDLENPLENEIYDEMSPLLTHIEQQNRKINGQLNELRRKQEEFETIIGNMNEGIAMLSPSGKIIAINNAAETLFNTGKSCIGKDFMTVERNVSITKAIETAVKTGTGETSLRRSGGEYQISVSRIGSQKNADGVVILSFDVTDKVFAERNRREFTANVSHELKTPLQSVIGSAELIENGLVKGEDIPQFAAKIHSEATRLLTLINDIIRLSQLDEKTEMPFEKIDLYQSAGEVAAELSAEADKKSVSISVEGDTAYADGNPRLVHELIYNLCENAVKYNREGGEVKISVSDGNGTPILKVSDTGIGIPPEHQSRIFERFYRVDKSHSNATGGTGLGLSIVKHAAEYLGAELELKSVVNEGTEISVTFPDKNIQG